MLPRCIAVVMLLLSVAVHAGSVLESRVDYDGDIFEMSAVALIDASPEQVLNALTNYQHLSQVNPDIIESEILLVYSPTRHRVRSLLKTCILFFCKRIRQVQDITQVSDRVIEAVNLPEGSDFEYGTMRWELVEQGDATHMYFDAQLKPAFWVPPLIGPWLVKRKLVREITVSTFMIEASARTVSE